MLAQIRRDYVIKARRLDAETEAALRADPRPGAKTILDAIARRRAGNRSEGQRLRKLLQFENALWGAGVLHVAGVDEAGMSPLAGPVTAAAVIFEPRARISPQRGFCLRIEPSGLDDVIATDLSKHEACHGRQSSQDPVRNNREGRGGQSSTQSLGAFGDKT